MRRLPPLALCLALTACAGGGDDAPEAPTIEGVEVFPDPSHKHVPGPQTYEQTPPVGGPHNQRWLRCGVYDEPVPNQNAVHSLEHRSVWVTYRPDLPAADVAKVRQLQAIEPRFVLISPYPGLPSPVVASAWGRRLKADRADDPRLAEFVRAYAGEPLGGEDGVECVNGITLEQARQVEAQEGGAPAS
jgi:hypothetical protein